MVDYIKNDTGITLVSLVITVIVMLILAGVSLSMVIGKNSVLSQAMESAFMQEVTGYKEQLAVSLLGEAAKELRAVNKTELTARGTAMRKYISTMTDEDIDDYMIIAGELYYVGDDEFEIGVCKKQGLRTKPDGVSKEEFYDSLEGIAMEAIILQMAGGEKFMTKKEDGKIVEAGTPLTKKVAASGFGDTEGGWRIITELRNDVVVSIYADGWYFVKDGTYIEELGTLKYSYIINYTTKKAVRFDSSKHSMIANNGSLAVKDGIVYIADPTNMKDGSTASWGNAVLHGFDGVEKVGDTVISGWTDTAFITDGDNDRVELKVENKNFDDGITIEFYGKILSYNDSSIYEMIFTKGLSPKLEEVITLGLSKAIDTIWFGCSGHRHWNVPNFDDKFGVGKQVFVSYRINAENPKGIMYVNNEPVSIDETVNDGGRNTWEQIRDMFNDPDRKFYFGYGRGNSDVEVYTNAAINTIRVYNRFLSEDEITANYNATVAYYNILTNGGNADNNNTGGDDFEDVFNK